MNNVESKKISIIVPVYNVESLLELCVESIINQTYSNFEILLIDDGSTDSSGKICDSLKERDKRVNVFHKKNGGLSDARNYGIEHSTGEFYLFIDSDDVLHPDFCRVLIELQKEYNADIVSTDLVKFYESEQIEEFNKKDYQKTVTVFYGNEILQEYYNPQDENKTKIYHGLCMKLYRDSLFSGLRFAVGRLHEDLYITYKLLALAKCFVFVDLPYYYYYQKNTNSITKNYKDKNFIDEYDALQEMRLYFQHNDIICKSLDLFTFRHYQYLLNRYNYLESRKNLKSYAKKMKSWLQYYLKTTKNISILTKTKTRIKLSFPHLYILYLKCLRLIGGK